MSSPKEVIEEIRKTKFLIGLSTEDSSDDVKSALEDKKKFLEDASRLAGDIHTMQPRFILELIQNADDNHYAAGVEPKLKFTIRSSELVVQNNEKGFNKENVEALCGIGGTTKKRALGYIGEKGIGFKSVFLVTDEPHIYSNGFQFKFKRDDRYPMSMIIPEWVEEVPDFVDTGLTNIVLPPKPEAESEIGQHISEIRPSLLLFLRKLRTIEIEDENQHKLETIRRDDHGAQVDKEWSRGCVSPLQESSALNDELEHPLDPFVDHDTYSQAAEEARLTADAILHKWRALPRPQDPHFVEADRLFESALTDLVASFQELCAACDAVDDKKAEEHGKKAVALLESYGEKFERAGDLLMGSKLLPRNRGGLWPRSSS